MFQDAAVESAPLDLHSWAGRDVVLLEPTKNDPGEKTMANFLEITLNTICGHLETLSSTSNPS
jgi:hypothetical protein